MRGAAQNPNHNPDPDLNPNPDSTPNPDPDPSPSPNANLREAGTGFNNVDVGAAAARGITVCNIPTYATEAMAHMAITFVMALSCSLGPQAAALARGERAHVDRCHLGGWAHFELTGKRLGLVGGLGTIGLRVAAVGQA